MLIKDKIELYEKLEKYLLIQGIETIKLGKEPVQKEIKKSDLHIFKK